MAEVSRLESLRRRVDTDPRSVAFAALAEEYRRAGRMAEAIATCRAGLLYHPGYVSARVTLGRALAETGQIDEAFEELELALQLAPENLAAIKSLAHLLAGRGDRRLALARYRDALLLAPHDAEALSAIEALESEGAEAGPRTAEPPTLPVFAGNPAAEATPCHPDASTSDAHEVEELHDAPASPRVLAIITPAAPCDEPDTRVVDALEGLLSGVNRVRALRAHGTSLGK